MRSFTMTKTVIKNLLDGPATLMYPKKKRTFTSNVEGQGRGQYQMSASSAVCAAGVARPMPSSVTKAQKEWQIDRLKCCTCNLCVEICPVKCLSMENQYLQISHGEIGRNLHGGEGRRKSLGADSRTVRRNRDNRDPPSIRSFYEKRTSICVIIFVLAVFGSFAVCSGAQETIRITCWEGYADDAFVKEFKDLVKKKYGIDVEVKTHYPKDQDEFYKAAKRRNGRPDFSARRPGQDAKVQLVR